MDISRNMFQWQNPNHLFSSSSLGHHQTHCSRVTNTYPAQLCSCIYATYPCESKWWTVCTLHEYHPDDHSKHFTPQTKKNQSQNRSWGYWTTRIPTCNHGVGRNWQYLPQDITPYSLKSYPFSNNNIPYINTDGSENVNISIQIFWLFTATN